MNEKLSKCESTFDRKKFAKKQKLFRENMMEKTDIANTPSVMIGAKGHESIIFPYKTNGVSDIFTPEEYFHYLGKKVESPQDIWQLINDPFINYITDESRGGGHDLYPSHKTMAIGGGDCDNLSWVAKKLFDAMGCRHGFDYEAKVISGHGHAICIFKGRTKDNKWDGKLYAINQNTPIIAFNSLSNASPCFKKSEDSGFRETTLYKDGVEIKYSINSNPSSPDYLQRDNEYVIYRFRDVRYDPKTFDLSQYISNETTAYMEYNFIFANGDMRSYDSEGHLTRVDYGPPSLIASKVYVDGKIESVSYANGESKIFDLATGKLKFVLHANGMIDIYNLKTNEREATLYPKDSPLKRTEYFAGGKHVKLVTNKPSARANARYETIWFDKDNNNKVIKVKYWDGRVQKFDG